MYDLFDFFIDSILVTVVVARSFHLILNTRLVCTKNDLKMAEERVASLLKGLIKLNVVIFIGMKIVL